MRRTCRIQKPLEPRTFLLWGDNAKHCSIALLFLLSTSYTHWSSNEYSNVLIVTNIMHNALCIVNMQYNCMFTMQTLLHLCCKNYFFELPHPKKNKLSKSWGFFCFNFLVYQQFSQSGKTRTGVRFSPVDSKWTQPSISFSCLLLRSLGE